MAGKPQQTGVDGSFYFIKEHVSTKWKDLAKNLGFKQTDINNITSRTKDSKSRCMEMLGDWKKRKRDGASIDVLVTALRRAGLQNVVDGLEKTGKKMKRKRKRKRKKHTEQSRDESVPCFRNGHGQTELDARQPSTSNQKRKVQNGDHTLQEDVDKGTRSVSEDRAVQDEGDTESYFEKVIEEVSSRWDDLARKLGFSRNEIKGIQSVEPSVDHRCREMLQRWSCRNGRNATLQALKQALIEIDEKKTAEILEKQNSRATEVSRVETKRKRQCEKQTVVKRVKKQKTESEGEPHETDEAYTASVFDKVVDDSRNVFNDEVLQDPKKFSKAVKAFKRNVDTLLLFGAPKRCTAAKVMIKGKVRGEVNRVYDNLFTDEVQSKTALYDSLSRSFKIFGATLKSIAQGCVLCYLEFENDSCYDTFLSAYRDGRLSDTLTRELITDDMRAEEGEDLYVHVILLEVDGEFQDYSRSDEGRLGNHVARSTDIGTSEHEEDDTSSDTSDEENNVYFSLLKKSQRIFDETTVTNPDKFEEETKFFRQHLVAVIGKLGSDSKRPLLEKRVKLRLARAVGHHVQEVHEIAFTKRALSDLKTYNRVVNCFQGFCANLKKVKRGCVLCYLDFDDTSCYRTFLAAYRDGSLSETLTRELITDGMRAVEGEDLYVHVTLLGVDGEYQDCGLSDEDDGRRHDDGHSDEEEPSGPTEGSQVGRTTSKFPDIFNKQEQGHVKADPSGTTERGPPYPGPSREQTGQGPPAPGSSNYGDDTPPGYHGDDTGGRQVSSGGDVIQVKEEPAEQVSFFCKSEIEMVVKEESEFDRQFCAIADHLGFMWERLALYLGFNTDYVRDLTARLPPSLRPHQLICDWMERNVGDVTLGQLIQALRDAGIHEVADAVSSGQLLLTEADREAAKGKSDEDMDTGRTDVDSGQSFLPEAGCEAAKGKPEEDVDTANPIADRTSPIKQASSDSSSSSSSSGSSISDEESDNMNAKDDRFSLKRKVPDSSSSDSASSSDEEEENQALADAATSGQLFATAVESEAAKGTLDEGKCDDEFISKRQCPSSSDSGEKDELHVKAAEERPNERLPKDGQTSALEPHRGNDKKRSGAISAGGSHSSAVGPVVCPTGEDALAWSDCIQDFFNTDGDTTRVIQESWPSNLLVKHLIRDRFFHSYLCEYWKQLQSFPGTLATFVEFVTKVSTRKSSFQIDMNDEEFEFVYESLCLVLGKTAYENESNNQQYLVHQGQLEWGDVQHSSFGLLQPTSDAHEPSGSFQFIHDTIRQFLIAKWVVHSVTTTTEGGQQLTIFVKKSAALPLSCYCVAYFLGQSDSHGNHLLQFVNLLVQPAAERRTFDHKVHVVSTTVESKQVALLTPVVESLFPEKALDLVSLPEISFHGLHSLTKFMSSSSAITEIKLPNRMTCKSLFKMYPFNKRGVAKNISHSDQIRYLSYLPLFQSESRYADKLYFKRTDKALQVDHIQTYLLHCPSLQALSIQKTETDTTAFSEIAPYLLFTPTLSTLAVRGEGTWLKENVKRNAASVSRRCIASCRNLAILKLSHGRAKFICQDAGFLLLQLPNLEELSLSHNAISDDAIPGLTKGLVSCQKLKKVDLSHNKLSDSGNFLPPLPNMEEIDLSHNAISDEAVSGLAEGLSSSQNLKRIDLSWNKLSIRGAFLPLLPNLEEIYLSHNAINDETVPSLAKCLRSCQNLMKVDLSYNKLAKKGDVLPPLPNLKEIDLSHNAISDEAVPGLAKCLSVFPYLKKLNLSHNRLSDRGDLLSPLPNLEVIDSSHNAISCGIVFDIAGGLSSCRNLMKEDISYNKFSNRGDFLPLLPNLEEVDLSHNYISNQAVPALAQGLASCQRLKKVNLSYNKLSNRGDFLPPLPNLEEIDLSHNTISDEAVPSLAERFGSCQNLKKVNLSYNKLSNNGDFLPSLPNLEQIDLSHNAFSDNAVSGLTKGLGSCQNLKKVNLGYNKVSNWASVLSVLFMKNEINLSPNGIGDKTTPGLTKGLGTGHNLKKVDLSLKELSGRADFLTPLPKLEELDLSGNKISGEVAPGLAEGLGSCQNLKKVNLSYNMLSNRGDFLPALPNLEELDLRHNAISDEAVPGLTKDFASCQNLRKVDLSHNKLSDRGDFLPALPNLEEIDLSHNVLSDEAVPGLIKSFSSCQNLRKVNLSHNKLSNRGDFLPALPNLEEIDLSHNAISDEAVPGLSKSFGSSRNLKKVDLSNNKLYERVDYLPSIPNLEEIDLSQNAIRDEAVPGLAKGLASCPNLRTVNLINNHISNKGALMLLQQESYKKIGIFVWGNNVSHDLASVIAGRQDADDVGKLDLVSGEWSDVTPLSITSVNLLLQFLPQLPNLQELALCVSCQGEEEAEHLSQLCDVRHVLKKLKLKGLSLDNIIRVLSQLFQQLPHLEEIDISHDDISDEAVPGLAECLVSSQNLKKVNLSDNKLYDVGQLLGAFIKLPTLTHVSIEYNSIRDDSLPTIAAWLQRSTTVERVSLCGNWFSAEGVRDFVRTMKGEAYQSGRLLYSDDVQSEKQQWERLRRETGWIHVKIRQLTVIIDHRGSRSNNAN